MRQSLYPEKNSKSVLKSELVGIVKSDSYGFGSIPHFHEKWQFPKCMNDHQNKKYLSL